MHISRENDRRERLDGGHIVDVVVQDLTKIHVECIRKLKCTSCWKSVELVVIPKGAGKNPRKASSYRLNSLLPTLAKALKTLIVSRLETESGFSEGVV